MFRSRQYLAFFFLITLLLSLLGRLFYLQVISYDRFSSMASGQHNKIMEIEPRRGTIFDRYMEPLAINLDAPSIYCDPRSISNKNKKHTADVLSQNLNVSYESILEKLNKDKAFVWIKRKADPDSAERIKKIGLSGVYFLNESKRSYSNDSMASHIIGFVGIDNEGLEGLEMLFDDELKGVPGWRHLIRDAKRRTVMFDEEGSMPAREGYNLVLTIDSVIQYIVEDELKEMVKKHNVSTGSIVVMEPFSGKILALANFPDYNLNNYSEMPRKFMKNLSVSSVFEPGSVFKIVTASAALNEEILDLNDKIYCEKGEYKSGGRVLHDFHSYGELSFREVIVKSSNIGTVKIAQKLGKEKLYSYIRKFGFGEKTGVDLSGEVSGICRTAERWSRSDITTIPIGQGIAVTPIQLVNAISVIANGGNLMKPYIVGKMTTWEGEIYKEFRPLIKRKVLNRESCDKMKDILWDVVENGTGRRVKSELYNICGKTGTAQKVNPDGGYYKNKYNATFMGFAPKESPVISLVVTAGDPHPVYFGGSVAGPTFKNITERILQYYGTPKNSRS